MPAARPRPVLLGAALVAAALVAGAAPALADAAPVDLAVTTRPSDSQVFAGDAFAYVVTVANHGADDAPETQVAVTVPSGWTFRSDDAGDTGTAYVRTGDGASGTWQVGTLAAGTSQELVLQLEPVVAGSRVFRSVATSAAADPHTTDNAHSDSVRVLPTADLAVTADAGDRTPMVGGTVSFTARAYDNGPDPATGVVVQAPLPAGYSYVSSTLTLGSYDPTTGTWTVGSIQPGSKRTLSILARVDTTAAGTFSTSVTSDVHEPATGDNSAAVTVVPVPVAADLAVSQDGVPALPVGGTATLVERVTDRGPYAATGVHLLDRLGPGLQVLSATASSGSYAAGAWDLPALAPGSGATLSLVVRRTAAAAQTDTLSVVGADQPDPEPGNDSSTTVVQSAPRPGADLAVTAQADGRQVTATVVNNGPSPARSSTLTVTLPAGAAYGRVTVSTGWYAKGVWHLGTLAPGATATLTVSATPRRAVTLRFAAHTATPDRVRADDVATVRLTRR